MADTPSLTGQLEGWLVRLRAGDPSALDALIRHLSSRLQRLTHQMLRNHPAVRRWAQTDDVLQGGLIRLMRAVQDVRPDSLRDFLGLATQQIRRELIDLARHYYGPMGHGANLASNATEPAPDPSDLSLEASGLAEWCEFHQQIEALPEEEREVMDLLFYQGLSQAEAAELLNVAVRTVQRRWHAALVKLHRTRKGEWPGK